jgi:hypothetical protein
MNSYPIFKIYNVCKALNDVLNRAIVTMCFKIITTVVLWDVLLCCKYEY